jgi:hypothetical protein
LVQLAPTFLGLLAFLLDPLVNFSFLMPILSGLSWELHPSEVPLQLLVSRLCQQLPTPLRKIKICLLLSVWFGLPRIFDIRMP